MSEHAPAVVVSRLPHGTAATEAPAAAKFRHLVRARLTSQSKHRARLSATLVAERCLQMTAGDEAERPCDLPSRRPMPEMDRSKLPPMSDGGRQAATTPRRLIGARLVVQASIKEG